jgi:hypothetical protein
MYTYKVTLQKGMDVRTSITVAGHEDTAKAIARMNNPGYETTAVMKLFKGSPGD